MNPFWGWLKGHAPLAGLLKVASIVAIAGVFAIMLLTSADVVGRYLLLKPVAGAVEGSTFLLVLVISLGLGFAQLNRRHVYMELFVSRFPAAWQRALEIPLLLIALGIFAVMTWAAASASYASWKQGEYWFSTMRFPVWPVRGIVFVGLLLLCFQLGKELLDKARKAPRGRN